MHNYVLPALPVTQGLYELVAVHAGVAYVSGQVSRAADHVIAGRLDRHSDLTLAHEAARVAVLRSLSVLHHVLDGFGRIERVLFMRGFINASPDFERHPSVMDAASRVLLDILAERGRHARTSLGVSGIPGGGLVEIELVVALRDNDFPSI